ncbi:MAG TPA: DUF4296 domain-containing protein [Bacteroidales bacterium]|jgi:hypothetical protein|nr:DUF4296 domain-containing protein [Bacteroidales bacterium]OQB61339.1 MAG: hypothetical protein BWX96_01808 [Bacteroidetes bacterium ADurb.Bin145]HOU01678.1 DUF4296 domain-containing protein [Bacteroidales bacterium]HQG62601.1 DUF4296 domain-containing protein [Bacteroidales bacterium]HQK68072.1 DUF4296 domain-containing protein [Bacteroidales bacterium]
MIKRFENRALSNELLIVAILLLLLPVISCTKSEKKGLIPEDAFSDILYEIHLGNGLLIAPEVRSIFSERDTLQVYLDIIESHGYSQEQMEKTLRYYFLKQPKKLMKIYDRNIGKLSEMESLLLKAQQPDHEFTNLWQGKTDFHFPDTTKNRYLHFTHILQTPGSYFLKFSATVFPDDPSFNPHFTAFTCHADSIGTGRRNYIPGLKYFKDGNPHTYSVTIKVNEIYPVALSVFFFEHDNSPDPGQPHAKISDILLHNIL